MAGPRAVRVPGKLMLAGEYSVLRPGGRALAMAVDVPLLVTAAPSDRDLVTSAALSLHEADPGSDPRLTFVQHALRVARAMARVGSLRIDIQGHAGQVDGRGAKLGLGSSAAVTVGVVAAALRSAGEEPAPGTLFRLAALAHARAQGRAGSAYDVATQILGGVVAFRPASPERFAVASDDAIPAWLAAEWPELAMERLQWPDGLHVAACWVGSGAKTGGMMERTAAVRAADPQGYDACLDAMAAAAREVEQAVRAGSTQAVLGALAAAERALEGWNDRFDLGVVTDRVRRAAALARAAGCEGRTSGAGGGDCVLAFADDPAALTAARAAWSEAGLVPVDVEIAEYGVDGPASEAAARGLGANTEERT